MNTATRKRLEEAHRRGLKVELAAKVREKYRGKPDKAQRTDRDADSLGVSPEIIRAISEEAPPDLSLHEFMRRAWHVVEPATPFIDNWHLHVICAHLEACALGRTVIEPPFLEGEPDREILCGSIQNLLINMPPRCEKSLLVSVFFPCWVWTFRPSARFIYASYSEALAIRDALKSRRIIKSLWYQSNWGEKFKMVGDQDAKTRYENSKTGFRIATSVKGVGTGEGGDFVIVDDPHNNKEAESDIVREGTVQWWNETMSSRFNNPKTFCRIVVMQRVHEEDLSGDCLKQGTYDHLCLPMEYEDTVEAAKRKTSLGFQDPRTKDGELLWPNRLDKNSVEALKVPLGSYGAAGQLQQNPVPRGGGMFKREWFRTIALLPTGLKLVRYWDKAATENGGCHTAGVLMGELRIPNTQTYRYIVIDCVSGQWSPNGRNTIMRETAIADRRRFGLVKTYIEREGGSSGVEAADTDVANLRGYPVKIDQVTGSKEVRAVPFANMCEAGNVDILEGDWNDDYLKVVTNFPKLKRKDEVDASSGAFNKLTIPEEEGPLYRPDQGFVKGWNADSLRSDQ